MQTFATGAKKNIYWNKNEIKKKEIRNKFSNLNKIFDIWILQSNLIWIKNNCWYEFVIKFSAILFPGLTLRVTFAVDYFSCRRTGRFVIQRKLPSKRPNQWGGEMDWLGWQKQPQDRFGQPYHRFLYSMHMCVVMCNVCVCVCMCVCNVCVCEFSLFVSFCGMPPHFINCTGLRPNRPWYEVDPSARRRTAQGSCAGGGGTGGGGPCHARYVARVPGFAHGGCLDENYIFFLSASNPRPAPFPLSASMPWFYLRKAARSVTRQRMVSMISLSLSRPEFYFKYFTDFLLQSFFLL